MLNIIRLLICAFFITNAQAQDVLRVNNSFNSPEFDFFSSIWTEVAKRNGIDVSIITVPNKRALINTNAGHDHGDAARILNISKFYPNLVSVPETVYTLEIMAVTKQKDIIIKSVDDLKPYHVAVIRGMKIAEILTSAAWPRSLVKATDYDSIINLLDKGRIDVAVVDKMGILNSISHSESDQLHYLHNPPLVSVPLYMQLHKDSSQYVKPFEKTLKQMKAEGSFQKILKAHTDIDVSSKVRFQ